MPYSFIFLCLVLLFILIFNKMLFKGKIIIIYSLLVGVSLIGFFLGDVVLNNINLNIFFLVVSLIYFIFQLCMVDHLQLTFSTFFSLTLIGVYLVIVNVNNDLMFTFNNLFVPSIVGVFCVVLSFDFKVATLFLTTMYISIQIIDMNYLVNEIGFASAFDYISLNCYCLGLTIIILFNSCIKLIKKMEKKKCLIKKEA